jgi:hypothetical protein
MKARRKRSEVAGDSDSKETPEVETTDTKKELLEKTSGELRDVIRKEQETPPDGYKFPSTQRPGKGSELRGDLRKIVETHWIDDMNAVWIRIRAKLRIGENRSDHAHLHRALDDMREASSDAHGLWLTAKSEAKRWEMANDVTFAAMWHEATRALQHEKDTGIRAKAITDTDARAKAATLYPDEWAAQEYERERVKLTVDRMQGLSKDASEKCEDLRVMLSKLRG